MLNSGHALPAEAGYPTVPPIMSAFPPATASFHKSFKRELPDSQESFASTASSTFAAPCLASSSSNVSHSTAADTESTAPSVPSSQSQHVERIAPLSPIQARAHNAQSHALQIDTRAQPPGNTAGSPMSLDSPGLVQGFKRTASGAVKMTGLSLDTSAAPVAAHKRTKSTDTNSTQRIGELSAQLRTRLSYAMVKVQNGWERQSLEELEEAASQRGSPTSTHARSEGSRPLFESPITAERPRRPSAVSDNSDRMMMSPSQNSPVVVSRSLATIPSSFWRSMPRVPVSGAPNEIVVAGSGNGPVLAPPAEIGSRRRRRSSASHAPPSLLGSSQRKYYSDLSGTPRTPATPRAGILRMPSQQAEKDAVDTLLFMSSPKNSGRVPHTGADAQGQPSPLRPELAGVRRVMFENHPVKEKKPHGHAPHGPYAAHYRADVPR